MKDTGIVRNIDEMGRLVLPKEMRRKMDIESGDEIEFYAEDDRIVLRKYQPTCFFCGGELGIIYLERGSYGVSLAQIDSSFKKIIVILWNE